MNNFEKALNDHLKELLSFTQSKINDKDLAADIVQDSLLKALKAKDSLSDESNLRAWLYSILRNTIRDVYRKKTKNTIIPNDSDSLPTPEEIDQLTCTCMEKLIPSLNNDYAFLIRELEMNQRPTSEIAKQLNISANNLKVKRHRARQQLKQRLEATCRLCAKHACLDCTCKQV